LIERRAAHLVDDAAGRTPWIMAVVNAARLPATLGWVLPAAAGVIGILTDALGPERRINILSVPLLGVIVWNLGVYVVLALSRLTSVGRASSRRADTRRNSPWVALTTTWATWRAQRQLGEHAEGAKLAARAIGAFVTSWWRLTATLTAARLRGWLHLGAALLALGVLAGAYWRGIAFEYQATWESTFLTPPTVRAVLVALLGPASLLRGDPIPSAAVLAALRAPGAGEAAPWVHRYALTVLLVVVAPRLLLAATAFGRARRLAANLPIDLREPYFTRLAPGARPLAHVDLLPYGITFGPQGTQVLADLVRDLAGAAADLHIEPAAPYGAEPEAVLTAGSVARTSGDNGLEWWRVLVFSLAQSPEDEVHGELIARLVAWAVEVKSPRRRALVVVDASAYRSRLAGSGAEEQRLAERRRAWDLIGRRGGIALVHVDLAGIAQDDEVLTRLRQSVWPPFVTA
jgi:hypothetical protein